MAFEVALERATSFVTKHADAAGHARLRFVLYGERPSSDVSGALLTGQRADGGFAPFWAPEVSGVDATCFRLAQLEHSGADFRDRADASAALGFVRSRQGADGSVTEDAALADSAPPWCAPGDLAATIYLTANAGFWLAYADGWAEPANAAGRFLHNQLQKGDALASFRQANWLAAGLWHLLGWRKPFDYACAYLLRTLSDFDAGDAAWMATTLLAARVPADHAVLSATRGRLAQLQRDDGGWMSADGQDHDVHVTLEAIRALASGA